MEYITGIKCDNPDCDYLDTTVKFVDLQKWIDKKCPKCNTILLSKEGFNIGVFGPNNDEEFKEELETELIKIGISEEILNSIKISELNMDNENYDMLYGGNIKI